MRPRRAQREAQGQLAPSGRRPHEHQTCYVGASDQEDAHGGAHQNHQRAAGRAHDILLQRHYVGADAVAGFG